MPASPKKQHSEIPEDELPEQRSMEEDDDDQPIRPQTSKPITVNETDWVDQSIDVPWDEYEEHS